MRLSFLSRAAIASIFTLIPSAALADEAPAASAGSTASPESSEIARPSTTPAGRGVGLGSDQGLFGRAYAQGVRFRIPVFEHFAFNLRGISTFGHVGSDVRWELGGRAEIIGHTPVYLNLVRLYGGGGPEVAARVSGPGPRSARFGGGGHFGFEFFLSPAVSFFLEVGGHGGDELTAGGTALAGVMLYPFTGP